MDRLYQVSTSYLTAGVITDESGLIKVAAPILKWSLGKNLTVLKNNPKYKVIRVGEPSNET